MSTADDSLYWACFYGYKPQILELANQNNAKYVHPSFGDTPLHQACKQGWLDIVEILIEKYGCDPNMVTNSNQSLLHYACLYGHIDIVTLLIEKYGYDPNVVTKSGESPLHYACLYGHVDVVMLLIEKYGYDPSVVTKSSESLLHYACRYCHIDVVKLLVEKYGYDPNVVAKSSESLLHYACRYCHIDVVKLLVEKYGYDPNVVAKSSESLLHYACLYGHIDVVMLLIEKYGCDPSVVTKSGESLLHYACRYGNIDIVRYLINKQHLNPLMRDNMNQLEPLDYAVNNKQYSIAAYICQHCISSVEILSPNRIKTTINLIKYIMSSANTWALNNEDPMWKTTDGDNILQLVGSSKTYIEHIPSAVVLNSHNSNDIIAYFKPDMRTADGDTILEVVCQSRGAISQISSAVLIKWLSESNNLMKIVTLEGNTADGNNLLELICQAEKCLIQISSTVFLNWLRKTVLRSVTIAKPDCKTADGHTLLQLILRSEISISRIASQVLAYLLSNSRNITINEMKNVNPMWKTADGAHFPHALCLTNVENIKLIELTELMHYYILEKGWNPDTFDSEGNTILHIACQTDKLALVSYLTDQAKCNSNRENREGSLPIDMATSLEVINYLCQQDQVSVSSKTVIEWLNNQLSIDDKTMLCILQSVVDNHKTVTITKDGSTLLHVVCASSRSRDTKCLVEYLLTECQCDPNCFDSKGQLPLQLTSDSRIMKILVERGAKMTADVVFKVIKTRLPQCLAVELFALSSRKGTMLWHPTELNWNDKTALDLAYSLNKPAIVNYLFAEAKCDPCSDDILKSLLELTRNLNVAKLLIEYGARVTPELVLRFEAMEAAPNKHSLIKLMLTTWNPDDRNSNGYTALHLACIAGNPALVELLISVAHCDPNVKTKNEEVPIQLNSDLRVMKILIEHGAQMTTDIIFYLISMHNTDSRISDLFKLLTRKGTIVMYPNDLNNIADGYNALHLACKGDSFTIVEFLLSVAHCNPNAKSKNEEVPIQLTSDLCIMKKLVEHGAQMTTDVAFKLISMHSSNFRVLDQALFKLLTTMLWNPNDLNSDGYTALHLACKVNSFTIVNFLVSVAHCNPNVNSKNEEVPIQLTSSLKIMKTLVEHGAQMTTDVVFKLVSNYSSDFRVPELFQLSVAKGTMLWNPKDLNSHGYTALHLACKVNSYAIVNVLVSLAHCDPNTKSKNKLFPIQLTSSLNIMKTLLEHGAQMTTDVVFKLVSKYSIDFTDRVPELFQLSITKGTMLWNPKDLNSQGYTALHLACEVNSFTIVNAFVSLAHCDPNTKSKNKLFPIQLTSSLKIMKTLLERGAKMTTDVVFKLVSKYNTDSRVCDLLKLSVAKGTMLWNPNDLNSDGYTALHLACKADSFTIVNFLLSLPHCDPNVKNKYEEVPIQLLQIYGS
jgi:ankyrin repeat protein